MPKSFSSLAELYAADADTVIDVRAPAEYAEDHIPGAISLPVLSDTEREKVGTIYKTQSPFLARKIGAALVARNSAAHIEGPLAGFSGAWRPLVYCWRGGQRSNSFASILEQIGWRVQVIEGGYRSYRRMVVAMLHDAPLPHRAILLDGNTGTAKTDLLHRLAGLGHQALDLEGLARHRGSLFGPVEGGQPAQKWFETEIARALTGFDTSRPVIIEAESSKVGNLVVPPSLWAIMCAAPRLQVQAPLAARAEYLTRAYGDVVADADRLRETLNVLRALQGAERVAEWQALADQGDFTALAASLMEHHYDPRYGRQRARHAEDTLGQVTADDLSESSLDRLAGELSGMINGWQPPA